jgi:hypothetical protein
MATQPATQQATPHRPAVPWLCDGCGQPCDVENLSRIPDQSLALCPECKPNLKGLRRELAQFDHDDAIWRKTASREEIENNEDYRRHYGDY